MYVADYVLMEYGTGAIMAVPAPRRARLRLRRRSSSCRSGAWSRDPDGGPLPYPGDGPIVHSHSDFDGLNNREALHRIVDWLDREGKGHASVSYRLRDWLLSRQRYWGCPIPVVHCPDCGIVPVPEADLPVVLPDVQDYKPKGRSPLAAAEDWVRVACPACGTRRRGARRTRWTRSSTPPGTSCATATRTTTPRPGTRVPCGSGCRSTSTSAASSTRSCTCSTRGSS